MFRRQFPLTLTLSPREREQQWTALDKPMTHDSPTDGRRLPLSPTWSLPISPVAGYRMIEYFGTNLPSGADIIQALQPEPDRLGAWLPVPLASKKTAQARHHPNGFAETGRLRRRNRILTDETDQRFPFEFLEIQIGRASCRE